MQSVVERNVTWSMTVYTKQSDKSKRRHEYMYSNRF